ncbi:MAG: hypothetical protein J7K72_04365 [Candidatus Aenigmarchaeota archaeon]|nr:hypothetical protein [Candidatus Aenigmarchaeota archaeon]
MDTDYEPLLTDSAKDVKKDVKDVYRLSVKETLPKDPKELIKEIEKISGGAQIVEIKYF